MRAMSKLFSLGIIMLLLASAQAQDSIPSETFRIVKTYRPTILDANKIDFQPEIDDTLKLETKPNYKFLQKQIPVSFQIDTIPAARIKGEPLVKLYHGYARLGVGNALVPFGEVYYTNLRSKKYAWGIHGSYFNMQEVNDIEGSDRSQGHIEVFGKRFWRTNTLEAKLGYDLDQLNYYGYYDIFTSDPIINLEQKYNRFYTDLSLKTTKRDSFNLRHEANLHYGLMNNEGGNTEHHIRGTLNLNKFKNKELYELDVLIDHNQYDFNSNNTIIGLRPQISTIDKRFKVKVGLGLYVNAGDDTDFHFYPLAEVKYNVIKDVLIPYAGLKGEIRRVNYQSITRENLFVAEFLDDLRNTNEKYNLYLGIRGTLSSKVSFNLSGAIINTEDAYLYIQSYTAPFDFPLAHEFDLIYDEIDELRLKGEFIYRHSKQLQVTAQAEYFDFDPKREAEAWHRPDIKVNLNANYNLQDKIILKADLFYWGEQKALGRDIQGGFVTNSFINTLDAIFDANLGIEYRYTKRLSAFVQFNNIGGVNYEKYQNYAHQGFNVWGGFTYTF